MPQQSSVGLLARTMAAPGDAVLHRQHSIRARDAMDLLPDLIGKRNPITSDHPVRTDSQSTKEQTDFFVSQSATLVTALQRGIHDLCQIANKKMIGIRFVTEK